MERFEFTDNHFHYISQLIREHTGIYLTTAKRELIYGRLSKRLRTLNLESFEQYCQILKEGDKQELINCVNQLTTNVTSFFREKHHFDFLNDTVLPEIIKAKELNQDRSLRIWSAGCSSGEEPYSIAITVKNNKMLDQSWDVKILATDLDSNILDKARDGIYRVEQLEKVSVTQRNQCFLKGNKDNQGLVRIVDDVKKMISFKQLNLAHENWPMRKPFDIIFCRNVVIYFDKDMRQRLIDRFANLLVDGGYLFVGHSESLFGITNRFSTVGKTIHRKKFNG